jgi:hypothetical protein
MSDQKQLHRVTIGPVRAFACPVCNDYTPFEADRCHNCRAALGLHPPTMTMLAIDADAANIDGQRWVRCTQNEPLGCNWLVPEEEQDAYQRGRCLADSLIRREPDASDTIVREKQLFGDERKAALYPFEIPPPVVAKFGFLHRVIRETARSR